MDEAAAPSSGAASKNNHNHSQQGQGHGGGPVLERLYVCPSCFKYSKELVAWWGHVRVCHRKGQVPGRKIYVHPLSGDKPKAQQQGGKRKRGGAGGEAPSTEETVEDKGEWSIWEVDGEQERVSLAISYIPYERACADTITAVLPEFVPVRQALPG